MTDLAARITKPTDGPSAAAADDKPVEAKHESGLIDNQYEVEVKLSDLQNDQESPLYSVTTFEQLGLYVVSAYDLSIESHLGRSFPANMTPSTALPRSRMAS